MWRLRAQAVHLLSIGCVINADGRAAQKILTNPAPPIVSTSGVPPTRDDRRDRELLVELASGRREALGQLYDRHAPALFRHALALTRRQDEAEDLVHGVFARFATTGAELLGVRTPAGYLHCMLKTTWVDAQRRMRVGERAADRGTEPCAWALPPDFAGAIDIGRALDGLPPLQREVIVLHLVEGFSFLEVGRLTGVSLFTAAGRYRLAISRLRKTLQRTAGDPA